LGTKFKTLQSKRLQGFFTSANKQQKSAHETWALVPTKHTQTRQRGQIGKVALVKKAGQPGRAPQWQRPWPW
jgi:hypothetical protein